MIKELHRAITHHHHIQIIYMGRKGETTMRTLRPLEIAEGRLKAYCLTRKAPRVFVIDRILAVEPVVIRHAI